MRIKLKDMGSRWKSYALAGSVCVILFVCLSNIGKIWGVIKGIFNVFKPLFLGFVVSYILNPFAVFLDEKVFRFISRKKLRWILSATIALLVIFALITMIIMSFLPQVIDSIASLIENADTYIDNAKEATAGMEGFFKEALDDALETFAGDNGVLDTTGTVITENISEIIEATSTFGTIAIEWAIGTILAVYFLMAKENIKRAFRKFLYLVLNKESFENTLELSRKFNSIFSKYIICEIVDSLVVGVANYLFMIAFGIPNALVVSIVVGVTNLVPTFGPVIGAIISAFILLLVDPAGILPFLAFTVAVQCIDSYIIKPKLFGDALDVPGVLILVSIIVFGRFMGVVGMLLAIPFAAVLVYLYDNSLIPRLERKKENGEETLKEHEKEIE